LIFEIYLEIVSWLMFVANKHQLGNSFFMFLFINTANHQFISLALIDKKGKVLNYKKIKAEYRQAEKLLDTILKIQFQIFKLKGIITVVGPGGFTSLRIGIATANTLAWALQIPIVGVELKKFIPSEEERSDDEPRDPMELQDKNLINFGFNKLKKIKHFKQILPKYGREPNITLKK